MDLIEKYVLAVGKRLPRRSRLDLQAEIRSNLEDMLEDRSQQTGKPVDDTLTREVLQEYGSPAKVAAAYKPTRYLIGPRLYPFFEMVLKIVLPVLTALGLIGFGINIASTGASGPAFAEALGKHAVQFFTGIISAFGNIVLVFAILERVLPASTFDDEVEKWSPADLEKESDPDQVKHGELIFEVIFTVLGLAFLNLYPNLIGFATLKDSTWVYVPALSQAFFGYLPWINLLGVLQVALNLFLLSQGFWRTATRLVHLAVQVAGIVLAAVMLTGPSLVSLDTTKLAETLGESAGTITQLVSTAPLVVLVIVIVVESIEVLQGIWRLLNQRQIAKGFLTR